MLIFFKYFQQSRLYLCLRGYIRNWRECIWGLWHFLFLLCTKVPKNTVLLVEPNDFHGEILPGFARYFMDLGFQVRVITRYGTYQDNPFCCFLEAPERFCLTILGMRRYLHLQKIHLYQYILLTSACAYLEEHRFYGRYTDFLGIRPSGMLGYGMIEHELGQEKYKNCIQKTQLWNDLMEHTFVLTPCVFKGKMLPMLNPHYFGEMRRKCLWSQHRRIFIAVGRISDQTRNFHSLWTALEQFFDRSDFEVRVIGRGEVKDIPEKIQSRVKILGRLAFREMYNELNKADFFLPLLEPVTQSYYLHGCTSGSRQLILGFGLIPLIQKDFAEQYGFNNQNALIYDRNLSEVFGQAVDMTIDDYEKKSSGVETTADTVYQCSLQNLRKHIEGNV